MFCNNCGEEINENTNFCPNCGTEIKNGTEIEIANEVKKSKDNNLENILEPKLSRYEDIVYNIFASEEEILEQLRKDILDNGLNCYKFKMSAGETHSSGGGVLLGSGGIAFGGMSSKKTVDVWNPFVVKRKNNSRYGVKITVVEKNKLSKEKNGIRYEGRHLRIKKNYILDMNLSGIGCLFSLIVGIPLFFISVAILGGFGGFIAAGIIYVIYEIGKAITIFLLNKKKNNDTWLLDEINEALEVSYQKLFEEKEF